jgi:FkbM family methyltransferase
MCERRRRHEETASAFPASSLVAQWPAKVFRNGRQLDISVRLPAPSTGQEFKTCRALRQLPYRPPMIRPFQTLAYVARHPLASRRPFQAFYRYAWWQVRSRVQSEVVFDWIAGSKLVVKNGMTGATGNIYCGLHEFKDMAFLLHLLRPIDLFVDAGANVGSYTVLAAKVCGADVIAVEPDPGAMAALKRNVAINGQDARVRTVEVALGAQAGNARFTVGRDTMNHVCSGDAVAFQQVEMRTLDQIVTGAPVLLKMDVEGFEASLVAGAEATLSSRSLLAIITESADPPVRGPIEELGFRQCGYEPFSRELSLESERSLRAPGNFLFVRDIDAVRTRVESAPKRSIANVLV